MLLMAGLLCSTTAMADSLPAVNVPERNKVTLVADSAIADKQSFDDSSGNGVQKDGKKMKYRKPKEMSYRLTLVQAEFEVEKYRKPLRLLKGKDKLQMLQDLINKVALIRNVTKVEYNSDYTQLVLLLPDDTEYRIFL